MTHQERERIRRAAAVVASAGPNPCGTTAPSVSDPRAQALCHWQDLDDPVLPPEPDRA
jgi:hypothetical protein